MTIAREKIGEIVYRVYVYRDGKLVTNPQGEANISDFIIGIEVVESITSATIEIKLVVQDAAGAIGAFTGSEQLKIQLVSPIIDRTYFVPRSMRDIFRKSNIYNSYNNLYSY